MKLSPSEVYRFQQTIYDYFKDNGRSFPWRYHPDPYAITVSEVMLQQTQTIRVVEKFNHFLNVFPTFSVLSRASNSQILSLWQGLGYNRRALNLLRLAKIVVDTYEDSLPADFQKLMSLPGIGQATAGAILAYAFNQPVVFIETNIRTVFIHYFFTDSTNVSDKQLEPLIIQTLDQTNIRQWYYALTDYGVMLKKTIGNSARRSKHYAKQGTFAGSNRQLRSQIIKILTAKKIIPISELIKNIPKWPKKNITAALSKLEKEGLITIDNNMVQL